MNGIKTKITTAYTPQQNGLVERNSCTMVEMARIMLKTRDCNISYWVDLVSTIVNILNRSPTSAIDKMNPYEAWYDKRPNVNPFKVFGFLTYIHIPNPNRQKLNAKSEPCIFMGYHKERKSYKLYNPDANKIIVLRDVTFYEGGVYGHQKDHVEKTKSIFSDDIIHNNDHE